MYSCTSRNRLEPSWRPILRHLAQLLLCAALAGCAVAPEPARPVARPPQPPVINRDLALLVTDGSPAFASVAAEIRRRYPHRVETYTLGANGRLSGKTRATLLSSSAPIVAAIGLPAALAAKELTGKRMVFCQVFNYEDARLVSPAVKGVSMMPPAREQLRAWKSLSPGLKKVGLITGNRLGWLVDDAAVAAKEQGIELIHSRWARTRRRSIPTSA